jgi:hypothetical protein
LLTEHQRRQANVEDVLRGCEAHDVHLLDPADFCFTSSGISLIAGQGRPYYADANHLNSAGAAQLLRRLFEPCLAEIVDGAVRTAHHEGRIYR